MARTCCIRFTDTWPLSWLYLLADGIKRHGAAPSVELSHSGQYAGTYLIDKDKKAGLCQYVPSDSTRPDGIPVKALTKEQIADIVKAYGDRAALAKRAGFEMVMVTAVKVGSLINSSHHISIIGPTNMAAAWKTDCASLVNYCKACAIPLAQASQLNFDLPLTGKDTNTVILVNDYYLKGDQLTDNVVVMGGGLAGCELAVHLGQQGKNVHLVEMRDSLAVDCNIRQRPILMQMVDKYVQVHTGCAGKEITSEGLRCETASGEQILVPGTSIVMAVGQRANTKAVDALRDGAPFVRIIGDCQRPSNILNAMYAAYHAALDI